MKTRPVHFFIWFGVLAVLTGPTWGQEDEKNIFSGKISVEAGTYQPSGGGLSPYLYSHLMMESHPDLLPGLSLGLAAQANWQAATVPMFSSEPEFPVKDLVDLDWANSDSPDNIYSLKLDQAFLHWTSGSLDVTAGLFKPQWGTAAFFRPTDYFFPNPPLVWFRDVPLGSEGLDATCFLFDDLSVEGAARWLEGGTTEGVLRLVDKGIGISVTPSFAWLSGRNGFGLEMAGTFPDFKVYVEAVDWFYGDGNARVEWTAGLSTANKGIVYTAEVLRDETGRILGDFSDRLGEATYVYLSAQGSLFTRWKVTPSLVTPLEGGPFLFWPKVSWTFATPWEAAFQAQFPLGNWNGPLDLYPGRAGLSISYSF